jgi:reverse transcriptase-like protein
MDLRSRSRRVITSGPNQAEVAPARASRHAARPPRPPPRPPPPPLPTPGVCPVCRSWKRNVYEHARKTHPDHRYTVAEAESINAYACQCGVLVRSRTHGLARHRSRSGCTAAAPPPAPSSDDETIEEDGAQPVGHGLPPVDLGDAQFDLNVAPMPPVSPQSDGTMPPAAPRVSARDASPVNPIDPAQPSEGRAPGPRDPPDDTLPWFSAHDDAVLSRSEADALYRKLVNFPTANKVLPPHLLLRFARKAGQLACRFIEKPSEENLLLILGFPSVAIAPATTHYRTSEVKRRISRYPEIPAPPTPTRLAARQDADTSPSTRAAKAVTAGRLSKACRLLTSTASVAPATPSTAEALRRLHPTGPDNPFGNQAGSHGIVLSEADIRSAIKSTSYDTAGGPSGWTTSLLRTAGANADFVRFLTMLANMISNGTAPGRDFLLASSLIPLRQPGSDKIRPIAIGEHFYRIAAKALSRKARGLDALSPVQFGVGSIGGVEPLVWQAHDRIHNGDPGAYLMLDLSNAFNTIDRRHLAAAVQQYTPALYRAARFAYGGPTPLLMRTANGEVSTTLYSSQGVRQGDPLGPLLFSVAYRDRVERIAAIARHHGGSVMSYLDDTAIWLPQDPTDASPLLQQASKCQAEITMDFLVNDDDGLSLNLAKTKVFTDTLARTSGIPLLGTVIGSLSSRRAFLTRKIDDLRAATSQITTLSSQMALLLLRQCLAPSLSHLLRTLDGEGLDDLWRDASRTLHLAVRKLGSLPELDDDARSACHLPTRLGGLGMPDYSFLQPHARTASRELCSAVLNHIERFGTQPFRSDLPPRPSQSPVALAHLDLAEDLMARLETHKRLTLLENSSTLGSAWISMIPLYPTRRLDDRQIATSIATRLLLSSETADHCRSCHQRAGFLHGDVCERRRHDPVIKRHNAVRDLLITACRSQGATVASEPQADAAGANPLLRGDLSIRGTAAPNSTAGVVDVTFTATGATRNRQAAERTQRREGESARSWTKRQLKAIVERAEVAKTGKYRNAFQLPFFAIVFTAGGTLSPATKVWFNRLGVFGPGSKASAFDLGAALVRARTASL